MRFFTENLFSLCLNIEKDPIRTPTDEPIEFEEAIRQTSFGKYNCFLLIFMLLTSFAFIFDTTAMAYVVPSAECDLDLSFFDKGLLNAIVHVGMICSAFFTGYIADTIGRKTVLFGGLVLDTFFNIIATFSHSFILTLVCKFFSGFFMAGITTVEITMMAEFHSTKFRSPITMIVGVSFSLAMLTIPLIALLILSNPYDIVIGSYEFHSWQMFMGACTVPAILASCFCYFVPESPKFLASKNRTEEALDVLRKIYSINTRKPADTFPVRALKPIGVQKEAHDESDHNRSVSEEDKKSKHKIETRSHKLAGDLKKGRQQIKPLFFPPHVKVLLLLFALQFVAVMAQNSMRLWLPQLFKMMSERKDEENTFCEMISLGNKTIVDRPRPVNGKCEPISVASETYINSMIVAGVQFALGLITSLTINYIGRKRLLVSAMFLSGVCTVSLYWAVNSIQVTALASFSVALAVTSINCLLSLNVDFFPTALRALALSLTLMCGRIGSIVGNLMFPVLLELGCLPPFLTLACGTSGGALLALLLRIPTTDINT